uniref:Ubiquitin-like domain-containing protein n=1 Tax=Chenopodium quinoa TaxID=63459 RepID=A0A803LTV5_CHEQI
MATRKRRYDPNVPIELSSEVEEDNVESSVFKNDETKKIQVKVVKRTDSNIEEEEGVSLKIEIDIPLRWVMICYCQRLGLDFQTTRFEFNAAKLRDLDTPQQLGMVQNDVIFAFPNHGPFNLKYYLTQSVPAVPVLTADDPRELRSLCLVYGGLKLTQNHTARELKMEDGDIIDGFTFSLMNSSLSIVGQRITLKVICHVGNETVFRVTPRTLLGQMMDKLMPPEAETGRKNVRFIFNGRYLSPTKTVAEEHLVDGDTISSMLCSNGLVHSNSRVQDNDDGSSSGLYQATICIRMHKKKDTLIRVIRATPLLPQLALGLSNAGLVVEGGSMCFVHEGTRLTQEHTAKELDIVNGDVIDAFIFDKYSCSLSIIEASKHSQESDKLYLEVSVASKYHETIYFRIKRNTRLKKLMDAYCQRCEMLKGALFFYHGRILDGSKSPDEENLVDKSIIYALPLMLTPK